MDFGTCSALYPISVSSIWNAELRPDRKHPRRLDIDPDALLLSMRYITWSTYLLLSHSFDSSETRLLICFPYHTLVNEWLFAMIPELISVHLKPDYLQSATRFNE